MKRREFAGRLAGAAIAWPLAAQAQQPAKRLPVVALVISSTPQAELQGPDPVYPLARAFVHRLRDLGWVDGRTAVIERRSADGQSERAPAILAEMKNRGAKIIVVNPSLWLLQAAQSATREIPIVAWFPGGDPVAEGLVASLARPGGNLTGVTGATGPEVSGKQLQLLKEMAPGIARVGVLGRRGSMDSYRPEADRLGVTSIFAEVESTEQFDGALAEIQRARVDALHVLGSPVNFNRAPRIVAFAAAHNLPTIFNNRESVDAGGLMSYGPSFAGIYRQLADYADRILKGAKPADLPVQRPIKFELAINLKTAKALGLAVPPLLLAQADEVIE